VEDTAKDVRERQKQEMQNLKDQPTGEDMIQEDDPERAAELRRVAPEAYDPRLDPQHQDPVRLPQDVREVREQMGAEFESEWGVDSERAQERQEGRRIEGAETTAGAGHAAGSTRRADKK
jgi:hypothetical protein